MTLYLATSAGAIALSAEMDHWQAAGSSGVRVGASVGSASCIAADPLRPERVFCGTRSRGVWRSDNAGIEWRQSFQGMPHEQITSLAVSPVERAGEYGVVYVGTEPTAIFRSDDGGDSWHECSGLTELPSAGEWRFPPRPETHHARWIELDPSKPERLFVAVEAGALISSPDGGRTWLDRVPGGPYDTHQLATHPDKPGRLLSAAGDGFFESDDAGETWHRAEEGLKFRYCWSVAVDPANPSTVVLSASPGPRQAHAREHAESAIYRRSNDHEPWQEVRTGLPDSRKTWAFVLSPNPAEPGVFYAASRADELYRSPDAGETWKRLIVDLPENFRGARAHALTATPNTST